MLSRAGLGDDAGLAHLFREERLAGGVVDLVRAGVRQAFQLDPDARAAQGAGGILGEEEGRRAPGKITERRLQGAAEDGIIDGCHERGLQLVQRGAEHLRDVAAAVAAEEIVIPLHDA